MDSPPEISRPGNVAQYWRSIRLLRRLGVPDKKLAGLFHTSEENIRQVGGSRVYEEFGVQAPAKPIDRLAAEHHDADEWDELARGTALTPKRAQRLLALEQLIEQTFSKFVDSQRFLEGAAALRPYLAHVANASHPEILRLRAILNQGLAWLYTHAGRSETSVGHALEAMAAAQAAYDTSLGDSRYLREYSESALIAANSLLLAHQPLAALRLLDEADHGDIARKEPIGSEHFRQRATALFQMGHDLQAANLYQDAFKAGEVEPTELSEMDLKMASDRQGFLFEPRHGVDSASGLAAEAASHYGRGSLQHLMASNWAAATALWLDAKGDSRQLLENLRRSQISVSNFGHQATVAFLLSITADLNLSIEARRRWLRFLLYENVFRHK
jgi:hypothetical protein